MYPFDSHSFEVCVHFHGSMIQHSHVLAAASSSLSTCFTALGSSADRRYRSGALRSEGITPRFSVYGKSLGKLSRKVEQDSIFCSTLRTGKLNRKKMYLIVIQKGSEGIIEWDNPRRNGTGKSNRTFSASFWVASGTRK